MANTQTKKTKNSSFANKANSFGLKTLSFVRGDETKSAFSKLKASFFAIIIGLLIGIIPIAASGGNALAIYVDLFTKPFNEFQLNSTLLYVSVFILIGSGIGVSFKTGLFNIGAAGQMLMSGAITVMMGIQLDLPKEIAIPVLMVVSMVVGALTAALAGFLKAQFNVHEVVSTILLNWIIFFIVKYIFTAETLKGTSSEASKAVLDNMKFDGSNNMEVYIVLVVVIALVAILGFTMKFTTFGFKLRMNGLNGDAAEYAGVNKKVMTISSMAISGAFIGLAGFIFYNTIQGQMPALGDNLPTIAFEAITVTLLAFSSPLGSIISGFFYGIIYTGADAAASGTVTKEVINLVIGLIVFASALAPILANTRIYSNIKYTYIKWRSAAFRKNRAKLLKELKTKRTDFDKQISEEKLVLAKNKTKLIELRSKWDQELSNVKNDFRKDKDIIKRDAAIKEINNRYKKLYSKAGFGNVDHLKSEKKSVISSMKQDFKIKTKSAVQKYESELAQTKKTKEVRAKWVGGKLW